MNKPTSCFAHNHMTCRQYGLWTRIRELHHGLAKRKKQDYVYFDADFIAENFKDTSRDVIYDDCSALLESGFFVLTAPRKRKKDGTWDSRKIRPISHSEWAAQHPYNCLNSKGSQLADSLSDQSADSLLDRSANSHAPLGKQPRTSRQIAIDQSLPDDKEASSSTEASSNAEARSRNKKPVTEQEGTASHQDENVSLFRQRDEDTQQSETNANGLTLGINSASPKVFTLKRWCGECEEMSKGTDDDNICPHCGMDAFSGTGWLKAPRSDAEGKRFVETWFDGYDTDEERRKAFLSLLPVHRRWIAMGKYADEQATVLAETGGHGEGAVR